MRERIGHRLKGVGQRLIALTAVTAFAMLVQRDGTPTPLKQIRERGVLRVVTLNRPTCYYLGARGAKGLDYDLASRFAASLGLRLKIYAVANEADMRAALASDQADIAAAQITANAAWRQVGAAATPYAQIPQLVVYHSGQPAPQNLPHLQDAKLIVRADSPQESVLRRLTLVAPFLKWTTATPGDAPLAVVQGGADGYAIVDARAYAYARQLYPNTRVAFALPQRRPVQWMVRQGAPDLMRAVNRFFHSIRASGELSRLMQADSGDNSSVNYQQSRLFELYFTQRLPRYRSWFQQAAARYGFDWRLLAAIGFQESRWNPTAVSNRGAKGVMMLTSDTAQEMGISDRDNAKANIFAGARYLAKLRKMVPTHIPQPDRTWFLVAAYNVGFGHVEDARVLAQRMGKNPDSWAQVSKVLPLLAESRWYSKTKYGYAQGWQPVEYVKRVQQIMQMLEWQPGDGVLIQATVKEPAQVAGTTGS